LGGRDKKKGGVSTGRQLKNHLLGTDPITAGVCGGKISLKDKKRKCGKDQLLLSGENFTHELLRPALLWNGASGRTEKSERPGRGELGANTINSEIRY